jgi:hypothetical protein
MVALLPYFGNLSTGPAGIWIPIIMTCAHCDFENQAGIKFCGNCGKPLIHICFKCKFENPPGFKFCGNCGTKLWEKAFKSLATLQLEGRSEAEHRHLTVMFCDLVGSTAMSHKMDPEELRMVIKKYQELCEEEVAKYDGHKARYDWIWNSWFRENLFGKRGFPQRLPILSGMH